MVQRRLALALAVALAVSGGDAGATLYTGGATTTLDANLPKAYVLDGDAVADRILKANDGARGAWRVAAAGQTRDARDVVRRFSYLATTTVASGGAEVRAVTSVLSGAGGVSAAVSGRSVAASLADARGYLYLDALRVGTTSQLADFLASPAATKLKVPARPVLGSGILGALSLEAAVANESASRYFASLVAFGPSLDLLRDLRAAGVPASLQAANGEYTVVFAVPATASGSLLPLAGGIVTVAVDARNYQLRRVTADAVRRRLGDEFLLSFSLAGQSVSPADAPKAKKVSQSVKEAAVAAAAAAFAAGTPSPK